jgi:hypothetical protein
MLENNSISAVPVVDSDGHPVGRLAYQPCHDRECLYGAPV